MFDEFIPLSPEEIKKIQDLAGYGLTMDKIAHVIGISKKTLERRMKDTPGVADAIEKGRADAEANITESAFRMAKSGKTPAMTIFWLKCRARWTEQEPPEAGSAQEKYEEKKKELQDLIDAIKRDLNN